MHMAVLHGRLRFRRRDDTWGLTMHIEQEPQVAPRAPRLRWQRWAFGIAAMAILLGGYAIALQRFSLHVDESVRGTLRANPGSDDAVPR